MLIAMLGYYSSDIYCMNNSTDLWPLSTQLLAHVSLDVAYTIPSPELYQGLTSVYSTTHIETTQQGERNTDISEASWVTNS